MGWCFGHLKRFSPCVSIGVAWKKNYDQELSIYYVEGYDDRIVCLRGRVARKGEGSLHDDGAVLYTGDKQPQVRRGGGWRVLVSRADPWNPRDLHSNPNTRQSKTPTIDFR